MNNITLLAMKKFSGNFVVKLSHISQMMLMYIFRKLNKTKY